MGFVNLHRHDHYSLFDGFGTAKDAAKRAKAMGQTALGLTNHGNVSGLIEHYNACNSEGIKPILGVEAYFQPKFNKEKPRYHLTLFAKSMEGYYNLMKMVSAANANTFYRSPITDFKLLKQYSKGIIATSGCVSGIVPRLALGKKYDKARKVIELFLDIFENDYYLEVQPYEMDNQIIANNFLLKAADEFGIPVVMTVDSHYIDKHDYDTYVVMHQLSGSKPSADYTKRYMPSEKEVIREWKENMGTDPTEYIDNSQRLADSCNIDLTFDESVPKIVEGSSKKALTQLVVNGLKEKGKYSKRYIDQAKKELKVILTKKFEDYFLLCHDIVSYARSKDIGIGFGRGSVCGSVVAYAIDITNVDPLVLGTHFERFLRPNKNTMPDIDIDFDSNRRGEVINYILEKYAGKAAPIATFGYYQVKNLVNDLAKLYEMEKQDQADMKRILFDMYSDDKKPGLEELLANIKLQKLNKKYKGIIKHFTKLHGQVRFIGRHAAGVAISAKRLDKYVALMRTRNELQTSFDLESLGKLNVLKMDILGLATVSVVTDAERLAGVQFSYDMLEDKKVYERFANGDTIGVFQFEKEGAKEILRKVEPRNIQELIACNALNRPAPIQLGIVDEFIDGKNGNVDKSSAWYKLTKDTYGTIVYQEHVMRICRDLARMEWDDVDKVMKNLRQNVSETKDELEEKFINGARKHAKMSKSEARELYRKMTLYLFNKGHGAGYTLLSFYAMWLKTYYPLEFFYALLKNEGDEYKRSIYKSEAVKSGVVIFIPHVNGTANYSIRDIKGEKVVQEGLIEIKGIGMKTANEIVKYGPYKNEAEYIAKTPNRLSGGKIYEELKRLGALEFDKKRYYKRVENYNASLYARSSNIF